MRIAETKGTKDHAAVMPPLRAVTAGSGVFLDSF